MTNIAVLGFGVVGGGIACVLDENRERIEALAGGPVNLKYILDLRDFPDSPYGDRVVHDIDRIIKDESVGIVCEAMGGVHPALEFSLAALNAGKSVVTSNKELVAKHGVELLKAAEKNNAAYLYEAAVGGGIDGMLNAGFATENLADLPQNLLIGGISGALGGYGMDKTLRKGMTALGPFLAKHSKSFNEIANMKNGVTGEKGFNKSMRMARKMQSEGNIPTRYPANMQEARDNAIAASKKKYDSLASAGDLEILDITNKLENLPSASMTPLKYDTLPQYQTRLRQEAQKSGMGLYGDINHFTKDGRKKMVHTLNRTLKAPDISMLKKEPEGFRLYTMRKYQADGQKPMYDLLMQRNEQEIFNKFATDKPRYVAEQFTGPALSLKSTKSPKNDLGVIMFPNNNIYLSKIGGLARESSPIQDAIKNVRAQNSAFVNLPDTDFKVLEAAGRHLDDGVRLNRFPAGGAEDNNVRQLYKLMDELQPEFPSYRDTLDVRYNREVAKNLANRPLQIYDRINNISNGRLDVSLPVGVSGDLSKYWVK